MTIFERLLFPFPPRNAPGGESAGATPAPGAGGAPPPAPTPPAAAPPAAPAPGAPPGATGELAPRPPAWTMPQGFPDRLKADTPEAFQANLQADWQAQHQKLSSLPQPPKDVSEYVYEPSDKTKPYAQGLDKDPVFDAARKAALDAGIPKEAFAKFIGSIYEGMIDQKLVATPRDVHAERLEFLGQTGLSEDQAIAAIKPEVERLALFVDGFAQTAGLDARAKAALGTLFETGAGLKALKALAGSAQTPGLRPGGAGAAGALTHQQLKGMMDDPRNDRDSPSYDRAFATQVSDAYRKMFG